MITLKVSQKGNALTALQSFPSKLKSAVKRGQRDAMKQARTRLVRATAAKYYLTAGRIRQAMEVSPTRIKVTGEREGLDKYKVSPKSPGKRNRNLSAAVKKAGGLKGLSPRAFLLSRGGNVLVMERIGASRLPIRRLYSLAIPQAVGNYENVEDLTEFVEEAFSRRLDYWAMQAIGAVR